MKTYMAIRPARRIYYLWDGRLFLCPDAVAKYGKTKKKRIKLSLSPRKEGKDWRKATLWGGGVIVKNRVHLSFRTLSNEIAKVAHARTKVFYFKIE